MKMLKRDEFLKLARDAISIQGDLYEFWRSFSVDNFEEEGFHSDEIVELLKQLILKRIEVVNSFGLLVKISPKEAVKILNSRYLGSDICPYSKFGGYKYELGIMLSDYIEDRGKEKFISEVLVNYLTSDRLQDYNVVSAFCEALDFESENEFKNLIKQLQKK